MELSYWGISPNIPAWPTDENGEREQAVLLAHTFDSPADADVTISLLTAYGIPCFKYYDKEGGAGKVINGFSGFGVGLYVPASMAEDVGITPCFSPCWSISRTLGTRISSLMRGPSLTGGACIGRRIGFRS